VSHPVQHYSRWFTDYPSTHAEAGATVEVVVASEYEKLEAENERLREALEAALMRLEENNEPWATGIVREALRVDDNSAR
jgi:hypothetical protein